MDISWANTVLDFPIWQKLENKQKDEEFVYQRESTYIFENNIDSLMDILKNDQKNIQNNDLVTKQLKQQDFTSGNMDSQLHFSTHFQNQQLFNQEIVNIPDMIDYNVRIALLKRNSNQKVHSNSRILDIYLPKFKHFLKNYIKKNYGQMNLQEKKLKHQLNNLPGMTRVKNIKVFKSLLEVKQICGIPISMSKIMTQYLNCNTSLLDALFPLFNQNGSLRKNKLQKKSTTNITSFFAIYEMMTKINNNQQQAQQIEKSFQNIWYYSNTTSKQYQPFYLHK